MPLLVLDRDGVINRDSDNYIRQLSDWQPLPGSIEAIASPVPGGLSHRCRHQPVGAGSRGYFHPGPAGGNSRCTVPGGRGAGWPYRRAFSTVRTCRKRDAIAANRLPACLRCHSRTRTGGINCKGHGSSATASRTCEAGQAAGCRPALVKTGKGLATLAQLARPDIALDRPH